MMPSAQLTLEQMKEIIEDQKNTDNSAREVEMRVEDDEEVLDSENMSSVLNTVFNTINNEFEHEFLDAAIRLLNAHPIHQSTDNHFPCHKFSVPGLPGTMFLVLQVWTI